MLLTPRPESLQINVFAVACDAGARFVRQPKGRAKRLTGALYRPPHGTLPCGALCTSELSRACAGLGVCSRRNRTRANCRAPSVGERLIIETGRTVSLTLAAAQLRCSQDTQRERCRRDKESRNGLQPDGDFSNFQPCDSFASRLENRVTPDTFTTARLGLAVRLFRGFSLTAD